MPADAGNRRPRRAARRALYGAIVFFVMLVAAIVAGPRFIQAHPDFVTGSVDRVRNIVGPAPVSTIENTYYRALDSYDRLRYRLTGQSSTWALNVQTDSPAPGPTPRRTNPKLPQKPPARSESRSNTSAGRTAGVSRIASTAGKATPLDAGAPAAATSSSAALATTAATAAPSLLQGQPPAPAASAPQQQPAPALDPPPDIMPLLSGPGPANEGVWQPLGTLGHPAGASSLLWQTVLRADPDRPYAVVALVAMDLARSAVHVVPGTKEPVSTVPDNGLRTGVIPAGVQAGGQLLAAWNGGFKAVHGHYGMMTDGTVWLPAKDGMATAAIDDNGNLTIGAWGRGVKPGNQWAAWRQNNPPLIENGVINPDVVKLANTIKWGAALDGAVYIWRSGMGITQDGRWLIYAAGNALSVQTLTGALQAAGANNAMQLDVNMSFEHYVVFDDTPQVAFVGRQNHALPITSVKLIKQMAGGPAQFLVPDERDFFYLTARP